MTDKELNDKRLTLGHKANKIAGLPAFAAALFVPALVALPFALFSRQEAVDLTTLGSKVTTIDE